MSLTWMPPRKLRDRDSNPHPFKTVHWLVDEEGRVIASVKEPLDDDPEDSFDAKLYWANTNDEGYFISLEHAQAWAETRSREDREKKKQAEAAAASAVTVPQVKE